MIHICCFNNKLLCHEFNGYIKLSLLIITINIIIIMIKMVQIANTRISYYNYN